MNDDILAKEALTRELEHTIDSVSENIINKLNKITNNSHVTIDNFYSMTYILDSLESIEETIDVVILTLAAIKMNDKAKLKKYDINILNE